MARRGPQYRARPADDLPESRHLLPAKRFIPVRFEVRAAKLTWEWGPEDEQKEIARDGRILREFISLAGDDDLPGTVQEFARRYGPLMLCRCDRPHRHLVADGLAPHKPTQREPLAVWLSYSRRFGAIVRLGEAINRRRRGDDEDWATLYGLDQAGDVLDKEKSWRSVEQSRLGYLLAVRVGTWIRESLVYPHVFWDAGQFQLKLYSADTFGAITRQLLAELARVDSLAICSGCGDAFLPKRRPREGERSWCGDCGAKAANRAANRRYRRKIKSGP